jgi:hypothetical protein
MPLWFSKFSAKWDGRHRLLAVLLLVGPPLAQGCRRDVAAPTAALPPPHARFADVADSAGIRYRWEIPGSRPLNILQTIGNGCAFLDYDNDGNLDILLVGTKLALYRGDGTGHFADVTAETGLDKLTGHFLGCAVGDVDGDGYDDVFISGYRSALLLLNEASDRRTASGQSPARRFRDVTREAGIAPQPWATSCAFAETVPGSGRLDLYVGNYADFGPNTQPRLCKEGAASLPTSCGPRYYKPIQGVFYRNDGHGHFTDDSRASGVSKAHGRALGVGFADFDGSGRPGLAVANDEIEGDLFRPQGRAAPRFTDIGDLSGTARDRDGSIHGGMGLDWGDYDNDGRLDLFVATFQNESKSLYHNDSDGRFTDLGIPTGIGAATAPFVAFGCKFLDYDNDGWLDLAIANGHVQDNIQQINPSFTYRQSLQLFHNNGGSPIQFEDVSKTSGPDLTRPIVGRGLAVGDYDNDGKLDMLVVDSEGKPLLLHNQGEDVGHWLGVRLVGVKSNRDGYGALLTATVGGRTLLRQCQSGGSYMSASDKRVHFGLGSATKVDSLTVKWPSGRTDTYRDLPAGRYVTIREGAAAPN